MFFAYKKSHVKLPHALVLSKAPVACGIWSQHEFFARLLSLAPAIDFSIEELNYGQSSLGRCFATAVAADLGRPGAAPAAPAAPAPSAPSASSTDLDWSMFNDPLLFAPSAPAAYFAPPGKDDGDDRNDDSLDFDPFLEEEVDIEPGLLSESEDIPRDAGAGPAAGPATEAAPADDENADAKSESGASRVSLQTRETATDLDLLKSILGDRQLCFVFRLWLAGPIDVKPTITSGFYTCNSRTQWSSTLASFCFSRFAMVCIIRQQHTAYNL